MPVPVLRTARLVLTPLGSEGVEACMAIDADPRVRRYLDPVADWGAYRTRLRRFVTGPYDEGLGFWSIAERRVPDRFLGWVMLIPLGGKGPAIEIGYRLRFEAWGRGIATEAASAVRDHGFATVGLDELVAVTHLDNAGSQRVLNKLGLKQNGTVDAYDQTLPAFRLGRPEWMVRFGASGEASTSMTQATQQKRVVGAD